ncbi:MAG: 50S ribosomal protein L16 [candidate division WWE3 bacterium]|nr:50S ribosomal protein L16 [candidate division WWE3 bacterium]
MLLPKKTKFRNRFRGVIRGRAWRGSELSFGDCGLQALGRGDISSRQIEAARKVIRGYTERGGKLWVRIFPDKPVSKKPAEIRMGGGKSAVDHYAAEVRPGRVILEISGVPVHLAEEALRLAASKLPIKTKVIKR